MSTGSPSARAAASFACAARPPLFFDTSTSMARDSRRRHSSWKSKGPRASRSSTPRRTERDVRGLDGPDHEAVIPAGGERVRAPGSRSRGRRARRAPGRARAAASVPAASTPAISRLRRPGRAMEHEARHRRGIAGGRGVRGDRLGVGMAGVHDETDALRPEVAFEPAGAAEAAATQGAGDRRGAPGPTGKRRDSPRPSGRARGHGPSRSPRACRPAGAAVQASARLAPVPAPPTGMHGAGRAPARRRCWRLGAEGGRVPGAGFREGGSGRATRRLARSRAAPEHAPSAIAAGHDPAVPVDDDDIDPESATNHAERGLARGVGHRPGERQPGLPREAERLARAVRGAYSPC